MVKAIAPVNTPEAYLPYEGHEKWWVSEPDSELILQYAQKGPASKDKTGFPAYTVQQVFGAAVKANGNKPALKSEMMKPLAKGEKPPPPKPLAEWKSYTWEEYESQVRVFAKACIAVGHAPHDSVNIFGFNSPEWAIAMYGAMFAQGKAAGIYPSDTEEQVRYKSDHSNGAVAVVEGEAEFKKFAAVVDKLPLMKAIVCWSHTPGDDITTSDGRKIKTYTWGEFIELGKEQGDEDLEQRIKDTKPTHAACLVYTSGTTGKPKAVMIAHTSVSFCSCVVLKLPGCFGLKAGEEERIISYLPLSHIAGMMVELVTPLSLASNLGGLKGSAMTCFARPYDLKIGTLVDRLKTIKPTLFLGVPRVWEKIMEKLRAVGASTKGIAKAISTYAKKKGTIYTSSRQLGNKPKTPLDMKVANIILGKIKAKLGLNKAKFLLSGAAPLSKDCLTYFGSLGMNVNEAYGMSETTGLATITTDKVHLWGSVGREGPAVEVRILDKEGKEVPRCKDLFHASEAEQGEICFRGRNIMMGYMANPRLGEEHVEEIEQKNRDAIDSKGWMHSGDKGTKDERGLVKITGRYKEIIIGAGGENIAPVPIEDDVKAQCPLLSNVVMIGNQRKFNVMLVTLKTVGASGELPGSSTLDGPAAEVSESKTLVEAMEDEKIIKTITDAITRTNENVEVVPSNAAKVQKFSILPRDFSVQTGELTASLKLKRNVAEDVFEPIISKMYEVEGTYIKYKLAPTKNLPMGTVTDMPDFERGLSFSLNKAVDEAGVQAEAEEK